ncbi:MAG TPA: M15 family metallopeptidase [Verrucomicrobiae bacterium]|nr:M15 family metallopeptidase [Verrucomicrobiae bacterium]
MITSAQCLTRFGDPTDERQRLAFESKWMTLWVPPPGIPALPRRIYCHKWLMPRLIDFYERVEDAGIKDQIRTWDGCFNVRQKRGATSLSMHSWGLAFDINAAWNRFGEPSTMSHELVACIELAGLDWGGRWRKPDSMHGQLAVWPS